jgi:hypothetical protein
MCRPRVVAVSTALVLLVSVSACGGGADGAGAQTGGKDDGSYAGKEKSGSFQMRPCKTGSSSGMC